MTAKQRVTARSAALFVVLASLAFASSGPLARYARPVHPLFIAFGRVALAAVALSLLDLRGIVRSAAGLSLRQRAAVLTAGLLLAVHFALFLWGLDRTSLAAALSLISLEPLAVVLCAWAFFRVRPTRSEQAGVLLATAGAIVIASASGAGDHRLSGDLMVVGATVLYGLYVSFARALRDALPARSYAALVYASAALVYASAAVFLAAALPAAPGALAGVAPPPAHAAVAIVALALVPTLVGHAAVQAAARRMSPSIVALVSLGETLGGIVIGALWLDALPTATEIAGAAILLAGAAVAIFGSSPPAAGGAG